MAKKKITNLWKESIPLELATHDVGKGYEHIRLESKESVVIDEEQITEQIKTLAKDRRKKPASLLIEDIKIEQEKEEEIKEEIENKEVEYTREALSLMLKADLQDLAEPMGIDIANLKKDELIDEILNFVETTEDSNS